MTIAMSVLKERGMKSNGIEGSDGVFERAKKVKSRLCKEVESE